MEVKRFEKLLSPKQWTLKMESCKLGDIRNCMDASGKLERTEMLINQIDFKVDIFLVYFHLTNFGNCRKGSSKTGGGEAVGGNCLTTFEQPTRMHN